MPPHLALAALEWGDERTGAENYFFLAPQRHNLSYRTPDVQAKT
jgi:hypothetical protein